ncbi:MAG: hypothetical protein M0Z75_07280 [Nitrospiraceae bacterium]|nr:hypothetical protein [Nitrospiraceae bacterium]
MKSEYRACVSYLAGRLIFGRDADTVYECLEGSHRDAVELLEKNRISLLEAQPPIGRPVSFHEIGERTALYNSLFGEIYINISGNTFKGYAGGSSTLFVGKASGNLVVIYDYRKRSFFKYRFCSRQKENWQCGAVCRDCVAGDLPPSVMEDSQ